MMKKNAFSLLMVLTLLLGMTPSAPAAETAATIRLVRTTGTVSVSKSSGKPLPLLSNMRLYSGYHVATEQESYSWMNLDDTKLIKEDAGSEIEVRKSGKKLEVNIHSGNVFFDISEKLEDDESLNIKTSTMIVGIRGTAGYVETVDTSTTAVTILEGQAQCTVTDPASGESVTTHVSGGETALCTVDKEKPLDKCEIEMVRNTVEEIPGFVTQEVVRNMELCDRIEEDTGIDVLAEIAAVVGGDPSGRSPDGKSASPEVLGEAEARTIRDESNYREKQQTREESVFSDKVFGDTSISSGSDTSSSSSSSSSDTSSDSGSSSSDTSSDSGSSSGDTSSDSDPSSTQITVSMPQTLQQLSSLLRQYDTVALQPGDGNPSLVVDGSLNVASGKTLVLEDGLGLEVQSGGTLQVSGTVTGNQITVGSGGSLQIDGTLTGSSLTNNGDVIVTTSETLRLSGNLSGIGTLTVTATGKVVTEGSFAFTGTLTLTEGAQVLAKNFGHFTAPSGWTVSSGTDSSGYYSLTTLTACTVTFNANGGTFSGGGTTATIQTDGSGRLVSQPATPTRAGYASVGWYTAAEGGEKVEDVTVRVFTTDTILYAHWNPAGEGWMYDAASTTLTLSGDVEITSSAPWSAYSASITNVIIEDTVTSVGAYAFSGCTNLTNVTISNSVTEIGDFAFARTGLTSVTIPASVTILGTYVFDQCPNLQSAALHCKVPLSENDYYELPSGFFYGCESLTSVTFPENMNAVGYEAFSYCKSLTEIELPEGVIYIGAYAFGACGKLVKVTIPSTMTDLDGAAFESTQIEQIIFHGTQATWDERRFGTEFPNITPTFTRFTITFDPAGGTIDGNPETITRETGDDGKVINWPSNPVKNGTTFDAWGDERYSSDSIFTKDTTITATYTN